MGGKRGGLGLTENGASEEATPLILWCGQEPMSNHLPLTSMPMQTGSAPQLPLLVRDCDQRQLFGLLQVEIETMVRHEFIRNRIGLPSARGVGLQGVPRDVENYPPCQQ